MARTFNGSSDYLTFTDCTYGIGTLTKQKAFTLSVWFRPTTVNSARHVIYGDWNSGGSSQSHCLEVNASNHFAVTWAGSAVGTLDTGITATAGNWYHAWVVWDLVRAKTYINGVLGNDQAFTSIHPGTHIAIGRGGDFVGIYFAGDIAEFSIWDAPLAQ